ncbi:hypothetical protein C1Y35_19845 [Pseudomonas sp. GW456-L14]|uniref:hypothetical protein n=1 Tax=unclassified Pseudomonas TaxID=196821 RepID=UPI000C87DDFF|nr:MULTISPECIES: hypothetical protein [unclassified Pseudomonas]PMY37340.1 hypothetical protein C1Y35_19845 [Pseudomonas sp. GW456-L14]PMY59343.1 hypothetical protein C1Y34_02125 [Pseudomonas sp. GW456-L12]
MNDDAKRFEEEIEETFNQNLFTKLEWEGRGVDPALQRLVDLVNNVKAEIGVTLSIGAGFISGVVIPLDRYWELFAEQCTRSLNGSEEMRRSFLSWHSEPPEGVLLPAQFVHLRDAKMHTPDGAIPVEEGALWRGKLSSVEGFIIGKFSPK